MSLRGRDIFNTIMYSTPRPTIDVDMKICNDVVIKRHKDLRKKIHASHDLRRVIRNYRDLQINLMYAKHSCSKKAAKKYSEDPDPYEKGYVFYCV